MDRASEAGANGTSLIVGVSREGDSETEQIKRALEKPMVGVFLTTNPELIRSLHAMVEASLKSDAEKTCETCNDVSCEKKRRPN